MDLSQELAEARRYRTYIEDTADTYNLPVPVLLGIGSRESRWGLALTPPGPSGTGDFIRRGGRLAPDGEGWGRGLMQIDWMAHEFARTGPWDDPEENINYGGKVLYSSHNYLKRRAEIGELDLWTMMLAGYHAAISAYNTGPGNVLKSLRSGRPVDYTTHGGDYSTDVIRRAEWFARNCEWASIEEFDIAEVEPADPVDTLNSNNEILNEQINSLIDEYNIIDANPS